MQYSVPLYLLKEKRMSSWKCIQYLVEGNASIVLTFSNGTIISTKEIVQGEKEKYAYLHSPIPDHKGIIGVNIKVLIEFVNL